MIIRSATEADIPTLAELYTDAIWAIAHEQYSDLQVQTWAAFPSQTESFKTFILSAHTFIAADADEIVGFSGIATDGHVTALYVKGDRQRQGIGSFLLTTVLQYGQAHSISRLYSEASEFSKPLFEKFGFTVYATEDVARNGVIFHRYLMEKLLRV